MAVTSSIKETQDKCLELLLVLDKVCKENNIDYWIDGGTLLGALRHDGFIPWDDDIDICIPIYHYHKLLDLLSELSSTQEEYGVYFNQSKFDYWCDCFGSNHILIDGIFPVRIDIIPVKFIENSPSSIAFDRSLTEIARYYIMGDFKYSKYVLNEHLSFIDTSVSATQMKKKFFDYFFDYYLTEYTKNKGKSDVLINYSFNDSLVKKERGYYTFDEIFPLSEVNFENVSVSAPAKPTLYIEMLYGKNFMELPPIESRRTHQRFLVKNTKLDKKETFEFLLKIFELGFKSLVLNRKKKKVWKLFYQVSGTIFMTTSLFFRGKFTALKHLLKYSYYQFFKKQAEFE